MKSGFTDSDWRVESGGMGQRPSKNEVYRNLKHLIIYNQLKPGSQLSERELSERFHISRTPLREILQRLQYQRLIKILPRRGLRVEPIDFLLIKSIFEVRSPIEAEAARLAARRATAKDIERLEEIVAAYYREVEDKNYIRQIELDQIFHETLGSVSKNPILEAMIEDLHNVCLRYWVLHYDSIREDYQGVEDLDRLVAAIRGRDHELAARLQSEHVERFLDISENHFSSVVRPEFTGDMVASS